MKGISGFIVIVHLSTEMHTACGLNFINSWAREREREASEQIYLSYFRLTSFMKVVNLLCEFSLPSMWMTCKDKDNC